VPPEEDPGRESGGLSRRGTAKRRLGVGAVIVTCVGLAVAVFASKLLVAYLVLLVTVGAIRIAFWALDRVWDPFR
jgi:hypothetical protein